MSANSRPDAVIRLGDLSVDFMQDAVSGKLAVNPDLLGVLDRVVGDFNANTLMAACKANVLNAYFVTAAAANASFAAGTVASLNGVLGQTSPMALLRGDLVLMSRSAAGVVTISVTRNQAVTPKSVCKMENNSATVVAAGWAQVPVSGSLLRGSNLAYGTNAITCVNGCYAMIGGQAGLQSGSSWLARGVALRVNGVSIGAGEVGINQRFVGNISTPVRLNAGDQISIWTFNGDVGRQLEGGDFRATLWAVEV